MGAKSNDLELRLLNDVQVAKYLSVTRACLRHWRAVGEGPPWVRIGERLVRYDVAALRCWIEEQAERAGGGK